MGRIVGAMALSHAFALLEPDRWDDLRELNRQGTTVLLVEQNARMALKLAHRGYVMETGSIVMADGGYRAI